MAFEHSLRTAKQIADDGKKVVDNQIKMIEIRSKELDNQERAINLQLMRMDAAFQSDTRTIVQQSVDFAIHSLPWWNRGLNSVMKRAREYSNAISSETMKIVAIHQLAMAEANAKESIENNKEGEVVQA